MENEGGRGLGMVVVSGVIVLLVVGIFIAIIGSMNAGCGELTGQGRFLVNNETGCWERLNEGTTPETVVLSRFGSWSYLVLNGESVVERVDYPYCPQPDVVLNSARMPYLSVYYAEDVVLGNFVQTSLGDFREKDREKAAQLAEQTYRSTLVVSMVRCIPISLGVESVMAFESFEKPTGFSENFTPDMKYFRMGGKYYEYKEQLDLEVERLGVGWYFNGSYEVLLRGNVVKTVFPPTKFILAGALALGLLGGGSLAIVRVKRGSVVRTSPQDNEGERGNSQSRAQQDWESAPVELKAVTAMARAHNGGGNPVKAGGRPVADHIAKMNRENWRKQAVAQLNAQKENGLITEKDYEKALKDLNKWV